MNLTNIVEEKRAQKANAKKGPAAAGPQVAQDISATLDELDNTPVPTSQQEREQYFVKQLSLAEELMTRGPQYFEAAAKCLLRVVKIYPDPMQLLMILEQSTPQPVFSILMDLLAVEMKSAEGSKADASKIEDIDD